MMHLVVLLLCSSESLNIRFVLYQPRLLVVDGVHFVKRFSGGLEALVVQLRITTSCLLPVLLSCEGVG